MLIHEDGTGLADAESYVSVEDANVYHGARSNSLWDLAEQDLKESSLRKATDFIDAVYGGRWIGTPLLETQGLSFPRHGTSWNGVPVPLKRALFELALRVVSGTELFADAAEKTKSEKIGPIEVEYDLSELSGDRFGWLNDFLRPLLKVARKGGSSPWVKTYPT